MILHLDHTLTNEVVANLAQDHQAFYFREEDKYSIMQIRNEQMYHLRQSVALTKKNQDQYFKNVVSDLFVKEFRTTHRYLDSNSPL